MLHNSLNTKSHCGSNGITMQATDIGVCNDAYILAKPNIQSVICSVCCDLQTASGVERCYYKYAELRNNAQQNADFVYHSRTSVCTIVYQTRI